MSLLVLRKSQIKIGENIAVLLVFFILVGIGLIFYWSFFRESAERESFEQFDIKTVEIQQKVFFLPELQCSENNIPRDGCVDKYKAQALSEFIENNPGEKVFYYNIFGFSSIRVYDIDYDYDVVVYNNSIENATTSMTKLPVLLYNPNNSTYDFGVMEVQVFKK